MTADKKPLRIRKAELPRLLHIEGEDGRVIVQELVASSKPSCGAYIRRPSESPPPVRQR